MTSFKQAYDEWAKAEQLLADALPNAPEKLVGMIEDAIGAIDAAITDIENRALQESEAKYKPILNDLGKVTASLKQAQADAKAIISVAGKADELIGLLGKLIPLLA